MLSFTPLLGAQSNSTASQSLLELDGGVKVLVDVGWDEGFNVEDLRRLERQIPTLSIILLTHATTAHIAAFAHCCKHFPLFTGIPIYATTPVISLGRTLLQDLYASTPLASTIIPTASLSESSYSYSSSDQNRPHLLLQPPTAEEIATYFSLIHPLKYSQPHQPLPSPFSPPLNGLTITAYNAGHTLGGTIWHIQHGMESIVYAVDWNLIRENVLSGAAWLGGAGAGGGEVIEQLRKPTALVCSSRGAEKQTLPGGRKTRDDLLLDMIRNAIGRGGTVLIPTDTSARVLELAYLLEHTWREESASVGGSSTLKNAKLYLASKTVGATMRYARSMLEWMDESVTRELEAEGNSNATQQHKRTDSRRMTSGVTYNSEGKDDTSGKNTGPFDFKYLKLLERRREVERALSNQTGQVILASDTSLEWGFSKEVLRKIAGNPANLIILTERPSGSLDVANGGRKSALGRMLWEWYEERSDGVAMEAGSDGGNLEQVHTGGRYIEISDTHQEPLEGKELLIYQQYLATQRQLQNTIQSNNGTSLETSADVVDETSSTSSSSDDSDSEQQGKALNISATLAHSNRNKSGLSTEELGVNILLRCKGVYDYDVRGKKGRERMFPFVAKRKRADDFGELIRPEEYLRAEERDDVDGQDMRVSAAAHENKLGQKRKWDNAGLQEDSLQRRMSSGVNKRRQAGNGPNRREQDYTTNGGAHLNGHDETLNGGESDVSEDDSDDSSDIGPSKVTYATDTIQVSLRIAYVDFSGLHDKRSLSMMIPLIQPRKLVLVGGAKDETLSLADECRKQLLAKTGGWTEGLAVDVFTPLVGQTIDASVDTNAWTVRLSDLLVKRLHWQNVRGLAVVTLTGLLASTATEDITQGETNKNKKQKLIDNETQARDIDESPIASEKTPEIPPTLDVLPASMAAATRSIAQSLHVGDLRLADLRKLLHSSGHTAEFRGEGTLLIDGVVAVRKTATGKIEVEGGGLMSGEPRSRRIEGTFHAVKKKVYEGLAVVAGG
ncbi:MAG: hypothetical protein M1830_007167 [Pleopsidium flavum]|nr:MAG: hypothetical protein M1830_007167 [Pleopsidium flavum]